MVEALGRSLLLVLWVTVATSYAYADVPVRGYVRRDGTYVAPHYRSSPNGSVLDNWSTRGNVNPYTGKSGNRDASLGVTTGQQLPALTPYPSSIGLGQRSAGNDTADKAGFQAKQPEDSGASAVPRNESNAIAVPDSSKMPVSTTLTTDSELRARIAKLEARIELLERTLATNTAATSTNVAVDVAGPKKQLAVEQWRSIKVGMSMKAVEDVLGKPSRVQNKGVGEEWMYAEGECVRFFRDGTVFTATYSASKP